MSGLPDHLENEWFVVRYSGEIPEIAYHSAIYFLTRSSEGPQLDLTEDDLGVLKQAAQDRFLEIILRDLDPANRGSTIYRGVERSIINFHRFMKFCDRQGIEPNGCGSTIAESLLCFLEAEVSDSLIGEKSSTLNCSFKDLLGFARAVGLEAEALPEEVVKLCRE